MTNLNSAIEREETPHTTSSTQNNTLNVNPNVNPYINIIYRRRAESVIRDRSIDPQSRAVIRYALETNDPWLSELMRRLDAGESTFDAVDFSQEPQANSINDSEHERVESLVEMICRAGDNPAIKSAALLVLMSTLEHSLQPKLWRTPRSILLSLNAPNSTFAAWSTQKPVCSKLSYSSATRSQRSRSFDRSRCSPRLRDRSSDSTLRIGILLSGCNSLPIVMGQLSEILREKK